MNRGVNSKCILRDSPTLKYAIEYKMQTEKITVKQLAKIAGVRLHRVYNYLDKHGGSTRAGLTQEQLLKIADYLNIKVEIKVSLS